jgi:hypothetical protein
MQNAERQSTSTTLFQENFHELYSGSFTQSSLYTNANIMLHVHYFHVYFLNISFCQNNK